MAWKEIAGVGQFDDKLWLVTPDRPEERPVIWLVKGRTPDDMHSLTFVIQRRHLRAVIDALEEADRLPVPKEK